MNKYENILKKCEDKISYVLSEKGAYFPTHTEGGEYISGAPGEWTDGFWPGMLWKMYERTGEDKYRKAAEECENKMDCLFTNEELGHDVGFMWILASLSDYKLTGSEKARSRAHKAALALMYRYNPDGRFIRSWSDLPGKDTRGWTIADTMMNLPILYWLSEDTSDPRFKRTAEMHTETVIDKLIRPDSSANHIIKLDLLTGEAEQDRGECSDYTQGCGLDSSWTRGQAWVIYGLVLGYIHTKRPDFLSAAKRTAHYFIAALDETGVPPIDFRAEKDRGQDSSAGAIAACGLIEIAKNVPECEKEMYLRGAEKILSGLDKYCADYSENTHNILNHGATNYTADKTRDCGLIYGDYFYIEAMMKFDENSILFW